ncbi:MAG: SH3 domain-containing protein [Candidatus Aminicenantes bacterium]
MTYPKRMLIIAWWWSVFFSVLITGGAAASQDIELKVVTEVANIRTNPDIGSPILHQTEKGSLLEYLDRSGEWFHVRLQTEEGKILTGYVHKSLVVGLDPLPVEPKSKPKEQKKEEMAQEDPPEVEIIRPEKTRTQQERRPPRIKPERPPVLFSLKGGFHYSLGGDLNTGAKGLAHYYQNRLNVSNPVQPDPHHLNYLVGADISIPLSSRFYVGVGGDYYSGETGNTLEFGSEGSSVNVITRPGLKAVPIRLTADFFLFPVLYIRAGVEYYFASCSYYYRFSQDDFWQEWTGRAEARGPGLLAGLGFTQNLTRNLDIFVESTARYAGISGFKGTNSYQDSTGVSSEETGELYFYQAQAGPEKKFPLLFIRNRKPSEAGVLDPQKAVVDFSGVSAVFGLKLRF